MTQPQSRPQFLIPENWIRDYLEPRYPDLVEPYRQAAQITASAMQSGQLDDADLQVLLTHAASRKTVLSNNVGDMLGKLAKSFPSALAALEQMAQGSKVGLRSQALLSMLRLPPSPVHERMYSAALSDKSKNIRMIAAQNIQSQAMAVLLPQLAHAIECETDDAARQQLTQCLGLLRDGFVLETDESGNQWVTCCAKGSSTSRMFTNEELETTGKDWIAKNAAEWKAHWYLP